jgi:hypothetical protein
MANVSLSYRLGRVMFSQRFVSIRLPVSKSATSSDMLNVSEDESNFSAIRVAQEATDSIWIADGLR